MTFSGLYESILMLFVLTAFTSSFINRYANIHMKRTIRFASSSTSSGSSSESIQPYPPTNQLPADFNKIDLKGLKSETSRIYLRTFKKIAKCNERIAKSQSTITSSGDENSPEVLQAELESLQSYLHSLGDLEAKLKEVRSTSEKSFPDIAKIATELGVSDKAPPKLERGEKKRKASVSAPRKPYHPYLSLDNIIIRVGREAADNDILSCDPDYRHPDEWWLHVSGFGGSHVVIKSTNNNLPTEHYETLKDAALLAAVNSRASGMGKVPVTYTRCRHVSKPAGAKAGLVMLRGDVATLTINIKTESARLERLLATKGTPES